MSSVTTPDSTGGFFSLDAQGNLPKSTTADLMGLSYGAAAITSAIGAYGSASATKAADVYQAAIQGNNQQIDQWQASQAIVVGQQKEEMSDLQTGETYATQRATMAANGVDLSESASAQEVLATTEVVGGINAATIKTNALNQAWGYQVNATNAENSQNFYNAAAKQINPNAAVATSLLTSASNVASKWYSMSSTGAI